MKWAAADARTGTLLGYLPDLGIEQDLKQTMSAFESASLQLPIAGAPASWLRMTKPWATALVALDDSTPGVRPVPFWGGIVQQRPRTTAATLSVPVATGECYLARRFIRDHLQYPAADWGVCQVGADLVGRYVVDGAGGLPGLPLRVVLLDDGAGKDLEWTDQDDKNVYTAFGECGFEFTVSWEWGTGPGGVQLLTPVLTIGSRIGQPVTPGLAPRARFSYPGNVADASLLEDWTDGKGANDVMLSSTGIGEVRPQSDHQLAANFDGRPTLEHREAAGTSSDQRAELNAEAAADLALLQDGSVAVTLTASWATKSAPKYGSRWAIGDDVGYRLTGPQYPDEPAGVVRAIGVQFNTKTFSPILAGSS